MTKARQIALEFPLGGLYRKSSYQRQAPFTTPDCMNVRAVATLEGRERGGSRPGLTLSHVDDLGGEVRMLSPMTLAMGDAFTSWSDNFAGTTLDVSWSLPFWADTLPLILPTSVAAVDTNTAEGEAVLRVLDIDISESYTVEAFLVPWGGSWHGKYRIYLRLDDGSPNFTEIGEAGAGVMVELTMAGSTNSYSMQLSSIDSGSKTDYGLVTDMTFNEPQAAWLSVVVTGDTVKVFWNGVELIEQVVDTHDSGNRRVGFGLECTNDGGLCLCNTFRVQYFSTIETPSLRSMLVASADGDIYTEDTSGRMTVATTDLTVRDDVTLQAVQSGQDLYIADYGDLRITQTDGIVTGDQLTATANPNWAEQNISPYNDVVVVSNVGGATVAGTYKISSLAAGALTLASSPGNGTCSFRIERAPKVFDPSAGTLVQMTATAGQVPTGCPLICRHLDRIVLAGAEIAPHVWYMARQSDPLDWDYSQEDSQRAVAGTASDAGVPGDPITALVPHNDDYLVIACRNSLWRLLGDPAYGGSLNSVSHTVGIVGPTAWCLGPAGELIFLSFDGLYALPTGADASPIPLSREVLPREFQNLNPDMLTVSLEYDLHDGGVHIFLTSVMFNSRTHWWFDWSRKTFWPVSMIEDHEPTATCAYQSRVIEDSSVILGCRDGKLRRFSELAENDCGTTYETYAVIGPIPLARDSLVGKLYSIDAVMADGSGDVTWAAVGSLTPEGAINDDASDTGTWSDELNATVHPACRGQAMSLKITGTAGRKWAVESITTSCKPAGRRRII